MRYDNQQLADYVKHSRRRLAELQEKYSAHQGTDATLAGFIYIGRAILTAVASWTRVQLLNTQFSDGSSPDFSGRAWGSGLGVGTSWGGGAFSEPGSQLGGHASIRIAMAPSSVEILIWDGGDPIGVFTGSGIDISAFCGSGKGSGTGMWAQ